MKGKILWGGFVVEKTFEVFISHKHEDYEQAKALRIALAGLAREFVVELENESLRLPKFFLSEEIKKGKNYKKKLEKAISDTEIFILLYANPTKNWDWCLYETGRFAATRRKKDLMIVLHHKDERPDPLKDEQSVKIEADDLNAFLRQFLDWVHSALAAHLAMQYNHEIFLSCYTPIRQRIGIGAFMRLVGSLQPAGKKIS